MLRSLSCALALCLMLETPGGAQRAVAAAYDVLLLGGTVIDGTGSPRYKADVAIAAGHIAAIGDLAGASARTVLDVTGLFVAPGFINIHSHATPEGLTTALNMLSQGVTMELLNADGGGPVDLAAQRAQLQQGGLALNVGANIGFNAVWTAVMGETDHRPAAGDLERMRALLSTGLAQGAWSVSAGLDYKPAYFATTEEVIQIARVALPWRTAFPNHDRLTPESNYSSRTGVMETLTIGEKAGLVPVVTHMKAQGREQTTAPALLRAMQRASDRGHYVAADAYPYLAGQSGLAALIIPGWAQDGGRTAMLTRFAIPELRARIVKEAEQAMAARFGGAQGVYAATHGTELTDAMRQMNVGAGEALVRLLEQGDSRAILRFGIESDLVAILKYPATSVACDCGASTGGASHPRYYGTFPRVLGRYVREQQHLTWEDAVRKMTGLPAATIGLVDRGLIGVGMAADIAVFDPSTVIDHATFEQPTLPSEGIRHVIVNGRLALDNGTPTADKAGQVLQRSRHMPSRAMSSGARRTVFSGSVTTADGGRADVQFALVQAGSSRHASGTLRIRDTKAGIAAEMTTPGVLQVSGRWASWTGRVRLQPSGDERAVLIIYDEGDPQAASRRPTIVIAIEDRYYASGPAVAR